jgi:glycosyltransferase involved in cell wall biosynthesis
VTTEPRVSVLIPCYNHEAYVRQAVESALAQTLEPHEVVVVDDGSTDGTPEILQAFGEAIRLFARTNHGIGATYNFALDRAEGDLVAYLESDDVLEPDYLEHCVTAITDDPDVQWISTARAVIDAAGRPTGERHGKRTPGPRFTTEGFLDKDMGTSYTPVVRRERLLELAPFDTTTHAADTDMALRFSTRYGMRYLDEPLYRYRRHDTNNSGDALFDATEILGILRRFRASASDYVKENPDTVDRGIARFAGRVATLRAENDPHVRRADVIPLLREAMELDPGNSRHRRRYLMIRIFGPRLHGWRKRRIGG